MPTVVIGDLIVPWVESHIGYSLVLASISVLGILAGLIAMRFAIIYMPADYFVRSSDQKGRFSNHHPAIYWSFLFLKNLVGAGFLIVGLLMLITPGPGVLLLLLGLSLVNIPGKRRLEIRLLRFPTIHQKIDRLRCEHLRPPLQLPPND